MAHQATDFGRLRLLSGRLCLDFVNTVENRAGDVPEELLHSYTDLVRWGQHAGLLTAAEERQLIGQAAGHEAAAQDIFDEAIGLRETLHRVFIAIAAQDAPESADLERIQRAYLRAMEHAQLAPAAGRFAWEWQPDSLSLDRPLWPVALSAIELLTDSDPRRVKVCANPHGCGWLFYDNSKNGSRRWCSMAGCGSQVKMRRQYAKHKAARGG